MDHDAEDKAFSGALASVGTMYTLGYEHWKSVQDSLPEDQRMNHICERENPDCDEWLLNHLHRYQRGEFLPYSWREWLRTKIPGQGRPQIPDAPG